MPVDDERDSNGMTKAEHVNHLDHENRGSHGSLSIKSTGRTCEQPPNAEGEARRARARRPVQLWAGGYHR